MIERDIVVVGAGPVGLTAALAVRATGRPVTVVEAGAANRIRPGSRAIFLHKVTLGVLERIRPGLGWELVRHGLTWQTKRTFFRGREVFRRTYGPAPGGTLPAATSLPQVVTEAILLDACRASGVEFVWNYEVISAHVVPDGVSLAAARGLPVAARFAIGADGSRSVLRESAGLQLEGPRTSNAFVIVDTAEDPADALPVERIFHYEHPNVGFRNVLFVPFAGHWRVDLQCHPGDDPDAYSSDSGVRDWLARAMPARYAERVTWVSTYIFRQAIANQFVDATGRILLVGEAAHVFAPFGARGLNSGVADAFVAASAIDRALGDVSAPGVHPAVRTFAAARRAAAVRNRAASSKALRHLEAASPLRRVVRLAAAAVAPSVPAVGSWLDRAPYGPPLGGADRDGMYY